MRRKGASTRLADLYFRPMAISGRRGGQQAEPLAPGPAKGREPGGEHQSDGKPDPVDRWSRRTIGTIACDLGAKALFPFGGPPYHPFYRWALKSGRIWDSPVRLLVSADQGLMVSFRGALALKERVDLPAPTAKPCEDCEKPCLTACPADALNGNGYDVPACHVFLDTPAGQPCLSQGCEVRRACPVSQGYARLTEQSAYHMRRFHGEQSTR